MAEYTYEELTDMHLTYDEAKEDGCEARRFCEQRFPIGCVSSHPTFSSIDRRLRKTGSFAISNRNARRSQNVRTPEMRERVLTRFEAISSTSTRAVFYEIDIFQPVVWRIVHEERTTLPCAKGAIIVNR